jgi:hypothetical protein
MHAPRLTEHYKSPMTTYNKTEQSPLHYKNNQYQMFEHYSHVEGPRQKDNKEF